MYYIHYRIIKCVSFKSIHNAINMNVASYFRVFGEFYYVSMYVLLF